MKKILSIIMALTMIIGFLGCTKRPEYTKYSASFFDTFDTITQIVGYTKTEEEFNKYVDQIHNRMLVLHKLYDKYNNYEGINNIKTINDNAGLSPVKVDKEIIELILFSKDLYENKARETNIALGSVLKIWSEYRDMAEANPEKAAIPPMEDLIEANEHTDINKIIVDEENSTIFLEDSQMSLDVGAVAKGYATEIVAKELEGEGFSSFIISAGGNIRTIGKPLDNIRQRWGIGIQNPDSFIDGSESNVLETVFINNGSVVSSGDYQRFYMVGDKKIHHLIDPKTLMPGDYFRAVTIVTLNSGEADFYSTVAFLLPYEESRKFVESQDGVEALWVMKDGSVEATDGMKRIMKSQGATGTKAE
ncbi:FAD:protein FMN transferase [Tissierella creatinini]|nr:FAD:protein FMN transferase [Tissierella creatinini]TJX64687.1 FAD:protein FMN transferase [Soehngenia saccharolytica]